MVKKEIDVLTTDLQSLYDAIEGLHETVFHLQGKSGASSGILSCIYDSCLCFRTSPLSIDTIRSSSAIEKGNNGRIGGGGILSMPVARVSNVDTKKGSYSHVMSQDMDSPNSNDIEMAENPLSSASSSSNTSYTPPSFGRK